LSGKNETKSTNSKSSITVRLELIAPDLKLVSIEYSLPEPEKSQLLTWLSRRPHHLSVGDVYDHSKEQLLLQDMGGFFESHKRRVEISTKIALDYPSSSAQLRFSFYDAGAKVQAEGAVGNKGCSDEIEELNLTDIDDSVPLPLVESLIETRAFSCFQEKLEQKDKAALLQTNLFTDVKFHITGSPGSRRISLEIRGKPLTVNDLTVRNVGAETNQVAALPEIPLRRGSTYSRSAARRSADILAAYFSQSNEIVHVFQEVKQSGKDSLSVEFLILRSERDSLFVNGKQVDD
jgi:hypothetical protein